MRGRALFVGGGVFVVVVGGAEAADGRVALDGLSDEDARRSRGEVGKVTAGSRAACLPNKLCT